MPSRSSSSRTPPTSSPLSSSTRTAATTARGTPSRARARSARSSSSPLRDRRRCWSTRGTRSTAITGTTRTTPTHSSRTPSVPVGPGLLVATSCAANSEPRAPCTKLFGCTCSTKWTTRSSTAKPETRTWRATRRRRRIAGMSSGPFTRGRSKAPTAPGLARCSGHSRRSAVRSSAPATTWAARSSTTRLWLQRRRASAR
mmetsp:Transcript_29399/g.89931  ORF Transcript_29399/g.89931 Transcript_29399/m.89931 type:complete len:200 (-) Transcript_29399:354-953(-)